MKKNFLFFATRAHQDGSAVYFIVDGDYLYNYETIKTDLVRSTEKGAESEEAYANG